MKKFLHLFAFVRDLERQAKSDKATMASMARYIDDLETLRDHQQERIESLQKERDELYWHLNGRRR